ncbi:MAG TPA: topoisomerase DNA-binding C4 zinc finger domain-containing protein, partial [Pirellulaceae bacterium]|nr:topoisomerase DNA-binding C4 zinc finger domain-containing protein [Pirellulaceae bacterium]
IVDVEFTAGLESKLDLIEEEKAEWVKVVRDFYDVFERDLKKASDTMESVKAVPAPGGEKCPECGKPMLLRMNRWGRFLGCSGYPECKTTQRIARDGSIEAKRPGPEPTDEICDKCGSPMVIRTGRRGRFIACSAFPKCKNSFSVDENNKPIRPIVTDISCEKFKEGKMVVRFSKRGPFLGCSRYPKCRGTQQLPKDLPEDIQEKIKARKRPAPAAESGDEAETAEPAETPAGASSDSADD